MKVVIRKRFQCRALTAAIWILGFGAVRLAVTGYPGSGAVMLILALVVNQLRDWAYPYEVRGFPAA